MLRKIAFITLLLLTCLSAKAQRNALNDGNENFWDKVSFGGGLGLGFGNGYFSGTLAPSAIYEVNPYFSFGPGLNFTYVSDDNFNSTLYGGSLIALTNPIPQLQLSAELEQLRVNQNLETASGDLKSDFWNTALFIGAGYRFQNITTGLRYNVLFEDGEDIYASAFQPFVRVYF